MSKIKKMTLSAVMCALSFVLVMVSKLIPAPWLGGGSVTLASMVPIILTSVMLGTKWGLITGFVFSLIQMMTGFYVPPASGFFTFAGVVFLDYIGAFTILGLAGFFAIRIGNRLFAVPLSGVIVTSMRYVFHIISGILIWGAIADADSIPLYSIVYNGSYMIPEIIITAVVLSVVSPRIMKSKK